MDPSDKLSIKTLLFTKAIPSYSVPILTDGYKLYCCKDCGDKYIFESSLKYHVNRKSMLITYFCRLCKDNKIFFNRCNLLAHIRSHVFKTATIYVSDLKVEPLPLNLNETPVLNITNSESPERNLLLQSQRNLQTKQQITCYECKEDITDTGIYYKDRSKHYTRASNEVHSCPVCLLALSTSCSLKAHLRLHLKEPPFFCPECGVLFTKKAVNYPYNHDCEGFNMMRATTRYQCPLANCGFYHPNGLKEHLKTHVTKVFKCTACWAVCLNKDICMKHLRTHFLDANLSNVEIIFKCEICAAVMNYRNIDPHLTTHKYNLNFVYPCWMCGKVFKNIPELLNHDANSHRKVVKNNQLKLKGASLFRVIKKCDKCNRSFIYKCRYNQIAVLPSECPYKCSSSINRSPREVSGVSNDQIKCGYCKRQMATDWNNIKSHYANYHKDHNCVDVQVLLPRINVKKELKKLKRKSTIRKNNKIRKVSKRTKCQVSIKKCISEQNLHSKKIFCCKMCSFESAENNNFKMHILIHRDPCMAYQCMECGMCFVGKPSSSTHLLIEHGVEHIEEYINTNECYNSGALHKSQQVTEYEDPLKENQCSVCRDQFDDSKKLQKHFRMHGMAFLMKRKTIDV